MVFTSASAYLDAPNWQQQPNHPQGVENPHLPLPLPPPPTTTTAPLMAGAIRPGSMADRARLAKVPQPEAALKCPRCDSTNTKFCYFNNYSLSQPRHFCKTCRRYWTRGGGLRNVPVGGGCRRNKRNKRSSSKSSASTENNQSGPTTSISSIPSDTCTSQDMLGHMFPAIPPPQLPFMAGLYHLGDYSTSGVNSGLNYSGVVQSRTDIDFINLQRSDSLRACEGSGGGSMLTSGAVDQWRLSAPGQQFNFPSGLEPPLGLYPFDGEPGLPAYGGPTNDQLRAAPSSSSFSQMISVKMEEDRGLNLSRQYSSVGGQDQYSWGGNAWNDISAGFSSSSTSKML